MYATLDFHEKNLVDTSALTHVKSWLRPCFQASSQAQAWAVSLRCAQPLSPFLYGAFSFLFFFFNWVWPNPNYLIFFLNLINWYIFWFVVNLTWADLFWFVVVVETWADFDWVVIYFFVCLWFGLSDNFDYFVMGNFWLKGPKISASRASKIISMGAN